MRPSVYVLACGEPRGPRPSWKLMPESEADSISSARKGQGPRVPSGEKRLILSAPRRGGLGGGKGRVVEVVHVRRDRSRPPEAGPHPAGWSVRAETWPEGFPAKPAQPPPPQESPPVVPESAPPAVHVMPMWEPSAPQSAPPAATPDAVPGARARAVQHRPRPPKAKAAKGAARHFADPFAEGDGANCLRCGYLVEPARERRGLLTCSKCG
jgi:hypothetical protein